MKKLFIFLLCILILNIIFSGISFADDIYENEPSIVIITNSSSSAEKAQIPKIDALAAIVMDTVSGRVLYEKDAYSKRAMASTTKIMTAIVALEEGSLNDPVTISERAASIWGSTIHLRIGETYTLIELMYGLLLNSGNDAAIAIAEHIGGTVENFADMMTQKAVELGARDTSFKTPHGLDAPDHYTTAYDLALITRYALKNPTFNKIVGTVSTSIPNIHLYNTNELLGAYPGADGVKTGYTGQAGRCLVASATRNNWRIISVVLNSPTITKRAQSSVDILDYAFNNYKPYKLLTAGEKIATLPVVKGIDKNVSIQAAEEISYPLKADELNVLEKKVDLPDRLSAPVCAGDEVGTLSYLVSGNVIASSSLKVVSDVRRKNFYDYFKDILREMAAVPVKILAH